MELQLSGVCASYGAGNKNILQDLSFSVPSGRRLCVLGENGSGKTTLLRVLAGILPYRGDVLVDGKQLRDLTREETGRRIALLTQMRGAYYAYTVRETISHGRYLRRKEHGFFQTEKKQEDRDAVERVLRLTKLDAIAERPIDALSGGQLQRVFLARAFVQETPFLLLDEPTNHLDLKYQSELADYLRAWSKEETVSDGVSHKNTMIGVFHDLALAFRLAEDVLLLKEGRLLAYGAAAEVLHDRALLQKAFDMDVTAYLEETALTLKPPSAAGTAAS